jgi:hypothetical protein
MQSSILAPGPGNPGLRLLKLAGGHRFAMLHDYAVATLVNERRGRGLTFSRIAHEFEREGVRTFRGRTWSAAYLGQIARRFPSANSAKASKLIEQEERP